MASAPSFSQPYLCIQPPMQSPRKTRSSTSVNFHPAVSPLLFNQIILTTRTNTPFLNTSAVFHPPIFAYNHSSNLHQKYFHYSSHSANSGCIKEGTKEIWNLVRNDTVLISPFFLNVWTVITWFTITDFVSFRLQKLVYCR